MLRKSWLCFALILVCIDTASYAYEPGLGIGAESHSLGQTRLFLANPWSAYNNPASMVVKEALRTIGISITNHFGLRDLNSGSIGLVGGNAQQKIGLYYYHSGNQYFGHGAGGVGIARRLHSSFSGGVNLAYKGIYASNYSSQRYASGSISGIYTMSEGFDAAFLLILPGSSRSNTNLIKDLRQQKSLALGMQHTISSNIALQLECEVFEILPTDFRAGIQYQAQEQFRLHAGFSLMQQKINYGFVYHNTINICFAFSYHNQLGHTITSDAWIQKK